ncbi:MAG TPA: lysylphosphatidylglycerol synthase transmembrane domain-containing protein [Thermoanaerobaculia bacterium]|nr:lysylphosphatidylglycerol synthase transmembrane domain-containing protein [Thermoanaerobaculia bacterium]
MTMRILRLRLLLRLAVSAALMAWILARTPFREVAAAVRGADPRFLLLALVVSPLGTLPSVLRWRLLIRAQGGDAPFPFLVRSFLTGIFFNNFLPSTIGGDTVRAMDTARTGVGRAKGIAIVFVDRFVGLLALVLFAVAGLSISGVSGVSGRLVARVPALYGWVLGGAALAGLAAVLLFLPSGRLSRFVAFQGKGRALAGAFAWSLAMQGMVVLSWYLLARALHAPVPFAVFFLIVPLALFVMMLPVSINAIGVRENVWAFFLVALGAPAAMGVALAWLDYGLVLLQALAGGVVYALGRRRETAVAVEGAAVP